MVLNISALFVFVYIAGKARASICFHPLQLDLERWSYIQFDFHLFISKSCWLSYRSNRILRHQTLSLCLHPFSWLHQQNQMFRWIPLAVYFWAHDENALNSWKNKLHSEEWICFISLSKLFFFLLFLFYKDKDLYCSYKTAVSLWYETICFCYVLT